MYRNPTIKLQGGNFTLCVIYMRDANPYDIRRAIEKKIEAYPLFFKQAPIIINIERLSLKTSWNALLQTIQDFGLHIMGVSGCCQDHNLKKTIMQCGLPILKEGDTNRSRELPMSSISPIFTKPKLVTTPVRSGQQIYAINSDLIITNRVGAGAEIMADGNIHIYGTLQGRALAGVSGDVKCHIFCTHLSAELISIAGHYWHSDQIPSKFEGTSAKISLQEKGGALTIHSL